MNARPDKGSTWDDGAATPLSSAPESEWDDWSGDDWTDTGTIAGSGSSDAVARARAEAERAASIRNRRVDSTANGSVRRSGESEPDDDDDDHEYRDREYRDREYRDRDDDRYDRDRYDDRYDRDRYDDDVEVFSGPVRRSRGCLVGIAGIFCTIALFASGAWWLRSQIDPGGTPGPAVEIAVPQGTTTAGVGRLLEQQGVIANATVFRFYAQMKGRTTLQAGRYQMPTGLSFDSALDLLEAGPKVPAQQRLTVPEGLRLTQVSERVGSLPERSGDEFMRIATSGTIRSKFEPKDSKNLEGLLFPETYNFNIDDTEQEIVSRMVDTFDQIATEVGIQDAEEKVGVSPYEAIIIASLIEREAKLDDERAKVSRVIYNRLQKADMALQIDATIVYAEGGIKRVLNEDLKKDGPYNTYTRKGLPPTPIAMPGRESLVAALNPEPGDWLYYVVTGADGRSSFANTYKEHQRNIKLAKQNGVRE
jgi:UPF0755 protein